MKALLPLTAIFSIFTMVAAQTPGNIFYPTSGNTVVYLDPGQDGYITSSGTALTSSGTELSQFEAFWTTRYQYSTEPIGDQSTGSSCSQTDIVDDDGEKVSLYTGIYDPDGYPTNNDGDEYFLCRIRIGDDPGTANFGYSVLIDQDLQFGSGVDANSVSGNEGFEIEIRLVNGGGSKGVYLDDVDGTTSGTNKASYGISTNHQKSYAFHTSNSCPAQKQDPVFMDIAIPFADLNTHFSMSPNDNIRMVAGTTTNGSSALGGNASDISGVEDDDPIFSDQADIIQTLVSNQSSSALPVELTHFSATLQNAIVKLDWQTAMELDNSHFEIERSENGVDFTNIGIVHGSGNSLVIRNYQFMDIEFSNLNGIAYYRLKQVDFDGTTSLSEVLAIRMPNMHENFSKVEHVDLLGRTVTPQNGQLHILRRGESSRLVHTDFR